MGLAAEPNRRWNRRFCPSVARGSFLPKQTSPGCNGILWIRAKRSLLVTSRSMRLEVGSMSKSHLPERLSKYRTNLCTRVSDSAPLRHDVLRQEPIPPEPDRCPLSFPNSPPVLNPRHLRCPPNHHPIPHPNHHPCLYHALRIGRICHSRLAPSRLATGRLPTGRLPTGRT